MVAMMDSSKFFGQSIAVGMPMVVTFFLSQLSWVSVRLNDVAVARTRLDVCTGLIFTCNSEQRISR